MDLKWQLPLLSIRARRYFQRTGKKITINGSDIAGYDKIKALIGATWMIIRFQLTWLLWLFQTQRPVLKSVENRSGQREGRPVWNHAMRVNHQNFSNSRRNFAPTTVLTKSGIVLISTARHSSSRVAAPETSPFSQTIKNTMEDLLLLYAALKEMCDKKNSVLFTKTECLILSPTFKLPDENQLLLKVPRKNNMYNFNLKNVVPSKGLTCLFAKAINDESNLWHWRLGYINFKTTNKLVKGNLVRGKFDGKANEGFLVGYSINSKAVRVYNSRTKKVKQNLHVNFLANKPNVAGSYPEWLFDIDSLTNSMNYQPVSAKNRTNGKIDDLGCLDEQIKSTYDSENTNSTNSFNTASPTVNTTSDKYGNVQRTYGEWNFSKLIPVNAAGSSFSHPNALDDFSKMANLEDTGIFDDAYDDRDEGVEADYNNLEIVISVSPIPSTRVHKDHPKEQIIREIEPKKVIQALDDESWVEGIQKELLQFKLLNVWTLVDLPHGKRAIRTKLVYRNKRDQRGIVMSLSTEFEQHMHNRFQISSIRELTFFLGLQVEQRKDGIFLSQDKYVCDILKKFGFYSVKSASTPMETHKPLSKDSDGIDVDVHLYQTMIGSLMYLSSSRLDIMFAMYACSRFQVQPKVSHMYAVKKIFRYLKGHPTLGLWYPKDLPLTLIAYSDSDYP
nr:hypothetical protein [Tanacetum cinerariifolium]